MSADQPLVSVIVTAYSEGQLADIKGLLLALMNQTYPALEIVFASENPMLCLAVEGLAKRLDLAMRTISCEGINPGASGARNAGINCARGDIIAFIDEDASPAQTWVEELVRGFSASNIIGVTGAVLPSWEEAGMDWFPKELYWIIGCTGWLPNEEMSPAVSAPTVNTSYRSTALKSAGGFLHSFGPHRHSKAPLLWHEGIAEDTELLFRLRSLVGGTVLFNPKAQVIHKIPRRKLGMRWIVSRSAGVGWSRAFLDRCFPRERVLTRIVQRNLVRRILKSAIIGGFLRNPLLASRRILFVAVSTASVALGYISYYATWRISKKANHQLPSYISPDSSG